MSNSLNTAPILGYYGKVFSEGDFISRTLPRSFREPWDGWVQSIINTSQKQMEQNWIQHYLTFPLYYFALSPGICGDNAWLGVIIPSGDKVGRYYPMTLCRSVGATENLLEANKNYDEWFRQAKKLIMSCLDDNFTVTAFEIQLQKMEQEIKKEKDNDSTSLQRIIHKYPGAAWQIRLADSENFASVSSDLTNVLMQDFCLAYSVWWTQGSDDSNASLILAKGLPPIDGAAAMLDESWPQWGWSSLNVTAGG